MADSSVPPADVELTNYQAVRSIVAAHGAELPPQDAIAALLAEHAAAAAGAAPGDDSVGDTSFGSSHSSSSARTNSTKGSSSAGAGQQQQSGGSSAVVVAVGKDDLPFRVLALTDSASARIVYRVEWERNADTSNSGGSPSAPQGARDGGGGGGTGSNAGEHSLSSSIASLTQPFMQASKPSSTAAMLRKQGRKVLRGPRSIPNLRIHASRPASGSRPAMPNLGLGFQVHGADGAGPISPPLRSAGSGASSHLAVPFPGEPSPTGAALGKAPQLSVTHHGPPFKAAGAGGQPTAASGGTSSPATRAAVLTEGDVWGALLGTTEDGDAGPASPGPPAHRQPSTRNLGGLGLDFRGAGSGSAGSVASAEADGGARQQQQGEGYFGESDASASEPADVGDTSGDSGSSLGFGQARQRRRRLKALTANRGGAGSGSEGLSPDGFSNVTVTGASPTPRLQHVSVDSPIGMPPPHRSASIGRGNWRSISPFGPSVVVKQANLRKVASSGLRHVRAALQEQQQQQGAGIEGRSRLQPTAGLPGTSPSSASSSAQAGAGPASPDMSDGATPNVAGSQTPRIQPQLREAPSFTSSQGSHRTARGGNANGSGSEAQTLHYASEGATDLQGLGEDAELVLQYPEQLEVEVEPGSRSDSPITAGVGASPASDPLASERFPKAFLPFWERSKSDDPTLIFDVFQTYAQAEGAAREEAGSKRSSLNTAAAGEPLALQQGVEAHKRSESAESNNHNKTISASPSVASTIQAPESSPHAGGSSTSGSERGSRHLSTSTTQTSALSSSAGGNTVQLPIDDPRFAIWTLRSPEQAPIVSIGAEAFVSQVQEPARAPLVSPRATATGAATSRFSVRPPATPETPGRERTRAFAQASPFAAAATDPSEVMMMMTTPTAANPNAVSGAGTGTASERRKQARSGAGGGGSGAGGGVGAGAGGAGANNPREDVLLPLDRPTLLAATKSRLVAELTSEIDTRMLTDFFFTYRLYMTPCELFRLLSLRFQWALASTKAAADGVADEGHRRIVRVRTYTVLKYWLNNLFEYDFLSDGALRSELTRWLNALAKDPLLANRDADLAIVKSLKKTVRELKQRYSLSGVGGLLAGDPNVLAAASSESAEGRSAGGGPGSSAAASSSASAAASTSLSPQPRDAESAPGTSPKVQDDVDLVLAVDDKKGSEQGQGQQQQREGVEGAVEAAAEPESAAPSRVNSLIRTSGRARSGSESLAPSWLEQRRASSQQDEHGGGGGGGGMAGAAQPFLMAPLSDADDGAEPNQSAPGSLDGQDDGPPTTMARPNMMALTPPTPSVQNPLTKAFSNTVTRLTKLGRALGNRSTLSVPFSGESGSGGGAGSGGGGGAYGSHDGEHVELTDLLADPRQLQFFIDSLRASQLGYVEESPEKAMLEPTAEMVEPPHSATTTAAMGGSSRTSFLGTAPPESESSQSDGTNLDNTPGLSEASASESTPASSVRHRNSSSASDDSREGRDAGLDSRRSSVSALGLGLGLDAGGLNKGSAMDDEDAEGLGLSAAPPPGSGGMTGNALLHRYTSNQTLRTMNSIDHTPGPAAIGLAPPAPILRDFASYSAALDAHQQPNVVQLDDIGLSSDEDDGVVRRALRRLPGARDLRTTNHVRDLGGSGSGGGGGVGASEARQSFDSFSMASGHGPVKAAYTSIPASFVGSQRSGSWQDGILGGGLALPTYPDKIGTVTTELLDPDEALAGYELVKGFRLDDVESDEEAGDVEAALRRLEGILDEEKQREKARRVERMFQESQARIAARERMSKRATVAILGDEAGASGRSAGPARDSAAPSFMSRLDIIPDLQEAKAADGSNADADAGEDAEWEATTAAAAATTPLLTTPQLVEPESPGKDDASQQQESMKVKIRTYAEQRSPFLRSRPALTSPKGGRPPLPAASGPSARAGARPLTFVPGVDLLRPSGRTTRQGRVLMTGSSNSTAAAAAAAAAVVTAGGGNAAAHGATGGGGTTPSPRPPLSLPVMHYSFLLNSAPETIAQQFTLIEAELFKAVTWDELVSGRWKERTLEALDWETFYQRTGRRKAECIAAGLAYKEQAVDAIIARFNLMCGWVASEVVLTQGIEMRAKLLSKLIRIAWKCYEQHNHATLTQILVGLQFPAVERLHKTWARLPAKHRRIFKDLKTFTSPSRNFAYLRAATQAKVTELGMVELMMTTGMSTSSTRNPFSLTPFVAPSSAGAGASGLSKSKKAETAADGFIPFFGLFTSTLESAEALPTFIDPSAPSCPVDMDPKTGALRSLANPEAFDHLPPLPATIKLEPLVNLFKARALALTVKTIVAFQERAAMYSFDADRNLYVKCLKVRTLQGHQQISLSSYVEP